MRHRSQSRKLGFICIGPWLPKARPEFLLTPTRETEAATRFFLKALHSPAGFAPHARLVEEQVAQPTAAAAPKPTSSAPRVTNVDKNAAYPKASGTLPESVELRQFKYLNNLVEQDHRFIKRLVKPGMGVGLSPRRPA